MPSAGVLISRLASAEYYFATLMDKLVDNSMQLEPVNEEFVCRVDELFYTIEAMGFFISRGIGTEDSTCMAIYNSMMEQLGINTTLPNVTLDSSLITVNPTVLDFSVIYQPQVLTQSTRLAIQPSLGLQVYQTDGVEGLYIYKSTGWTFIG